MQKDKNPIFVHSEEFRSPIMIKSLEKTESKSEDSIFSSKDQKSVNGYDTCSNMEESPEKSEIIDEDSPPSKEKECVHDSNTCNSLEVSSEKSDITSEDSRISKLKEWVHAFGTCSSMEVSPEKTESIDQYYWLKGLEDVPVSDSDAAAAYDEFLRQWYWAIDEKGKLIEPDPDEELECRRQWAESEGFDVTLSCGIMDSFIPYLNLDHVPDKQRQTAESCGMVAIDYYNKNENENMEFVRLLKVNIQYGQGFMYYLTFEAKDKDDRADKFQSKVWWGPADEQPEDAVRLVFTPKVLMCRKKVCSGYSVQGDV